MREPRKAESCPHCWPTSPCPFSTSTSKWEALGPDWRRIKRVIVVHGQRSDAEALWGEVAVVLQPMGLRLSDAKTRISHLGDGFGLPRLAHPASP